eukprot:4700788-Pleurochrysis_carterae.AAC.1
MLKLHKASRAPTLTQQAHTYFFALCPCTLESLRPQARLVLVLVVLVLVPACACCACACAYALYLCLVAISCLVPLRLVLMCVWAAAG